MEVTENECHMLANSFIEQPKQGASWGPITDLLTITVIGKLVATTFNFSLNKEKLDWSIRMSKIRFYIILSFSRISMNYLTHSTFR